MKLDIGTEVALITKESDVLKQGTLTSIEKSGFLDQIFHIDDEKISIPYEKRDELLLIPAFELENQEINSMIDYSNLIDKMFRHSVKELSNKEQKTAMEHLDSLYKMLKPYETKQHRTIQELWGNHHFSIDDIRKSNLNFKELKRKHV